MDSLITAAARSLAAGDPLLALKRVALRDDAPALALRGIAMAQLGDLAKAKDLLRRAARAFGPRDPLARARCVAAEAEIALVSRDLAFPARSLEAARIQLARRGDRFNAAHAGCLAARRLLLIGRPEEADRMLSGIDATALPPALKAGHDLVAAGIAIRRLRTQATGRAVASAADAARLSGITALQAEVEAVAQMLSRPAARLIADGAERLIVLAEVEALFASDALVIDACRNVVRHRGTVVPLASRPVLFGLARTLAEHWPGDATRDDLLRRVFRARQADESHRARLRVEIGRLRAELRPFAGIDATDKGFVLSTGAGGVVVLAPTAEEPNATVLALLSDGEAWSSSALALALGISPRSVQRALEQLASRGKAMAFGRGRARRWVAPPVPAFPTTLLLPGPLTGV